MSAPYRPGQPVWPENQPRRPDRPPPSQFRPQGQAPSSNPALTWTLRIVGLIGVAVVSGVVWWNVNNDAPPETSSQGGGQTEAQPPSQGVYEFTAMLDEPRVDTSCGNHSYGEAQQLLLNTPCEKLTRTVYKTTVDDRTVYTSVVVVTMADEAAATSLRTLIDTPGTGNLSDLVRDDVLKIEGIDALSNGGFDSTQLGAQVVIIESDYDPAADEGGTEDELDGVCEDAIRLGEELAQSSG